MQRRSFGELVRRLKTEATRLPVVDVGGACVGELQTIGPDLAADADVVAKLTRWRQAHNQWFFTQFQATEQRTQAWLEKSVVPDNSRLLFLVEDDTVGFVGVVGLTSVGSDPVEIDNVVRGEKAGRRGLMAHAQESLMTWAFDTLEINALQLHVFSHNDRARGLYADLGFESSAAFDTAPEQVDAETVFRFGPEVDIDAASGTYILQMTISRATFEGRARG